VDRRALRQPAFDAGTEPTGEWPVWREQSMLAPQGSASAAARAFPPYGWPFAALQLVTSTCARVRPAAPYGATRRRPCSRATPTRAAAPQSLAVSPYGALEFRWPPAELPLVLLFAELLCLDRAQGRLRPVASRVLEPEPPALAAPDLRSLARAWARDVHRSFAPESPVAALRYREVRAARGANGNGALQHAVTTRFGFDIVADLELSPQLAQTDVRAARDASSAALPRRAIRRRAHAGDRARGRGRPPQVTGVQPVYVTEHELGGTRWSLSALHVAVRYTAAEAGVIALPPHAYGVHSDRRWA
jgi:hypothetical protein